ncbi:MAG: hypothetical protein IRY92_04520, partial [Dactylosporangium sp.]|nr:hypothetical protein [Dactylosporangium sp.]
MSSPVDLSELARTLANLSALKAAQALDADSDQKAAEVAEQKLDQWNDQDSDQEIKQDQWTTTATETKGGDGG